MVPEATDDRAQRMRRVVPWHWPGFSAAWAVGVFVTDQLAWPLALWIGWRAHSYTIT